MPRKTTNQWEFGDLFEAPSKPKPKASAEAEEKAKIESATPPVSEPVRQVLTVAELTGRIRRLLQKEFGLVWVSGEISNFRTQPSGHSYFTLKDGSAQLNCVLFRGEGAGSRKYLQDGQKVLLQGDITVYEPRGQYQLRVTAVELQGVGALQQAFERLKHKLQAEGLFAPERKRPLPRYPQRIGLVTSPTGAAIRDVLHVIERRQPGLEIVLVGCRVQGDEAAGEIADAIRALNAWSAASDEPLDLILVTRGGGSLEDLWAFNEEIVARAIFESALPVVSAVGHEIDFTISDFVADLRAATPSAAAELITEGAFASRQFVAQTALRLGQLMRQRLAAEAETLVWIIQRLRRVHPRRQLQEKLQYMDDLQSSLDRSARQGWRSLAVAFTNLQQRLTRVKPSSVLAQHRQALQDWRKLLQDRLRFGWTGCANQLENLESRLRLLSPDNVLARGYSITTDLQSSRVLRSPDDVCAGQEIKTRLQKGEIRSVVQS